MKLNCLIIDDEPAAQIVLKKYISDVEFINLTGVCNNALEAQSFIRDQKIDILFLDINLPKVSGISFYKSLNNPPKVIFTTAYSQYAVEGFEVAAVDYLLKPFSFERFLQAINKLESEKLDKSPNPEFILIRSNKETYKVFFDDIKYVEAFGDYVKVYLENKYLLSHGTLKNISSKLPSKLFVKTHKSFVVNLNKITSIQGNQVLISEKKIPIGLTNRDDFFKRFEKDD